MAPLMFWGGACAGWKRASFVRLTTSGRTTPFGRATRPKNLGYGEARAGDSVRATRPIRGRRIFMSIRSQMLLAAGAVAGVLALAPAKAQDAVKIGLILP